MRCGWRIGSPRRRIAGAGTRMRPAHEMDPTCPHGGRVPPTTRIGPDRGTVQSHGSGDRSLPSRGRVRRDAWIDRHGEADGSGRNGD